MSDVHARLTAALSDRYRLDRELGAGGMATVYLAHDLKHDRDVAIKVLHPDLGAALGGERFLTEIRTTARLQHPHILPLLDSGDADGLLYYVMPLVTGETLRARLEREKQLPIADATRIAREVASALDYAHRQNVIHRDIKPENILLHDGQAIVADFGIALAVQTAAGARMTQTGLSLGTPQYMSPEQAMGERTIDARSDIYALGAVLYEMLTGEAPFTGPSVQAIVAKVLSEKPTSLRTVRDTVPPVVEHAVFTALAKLPADRFESAAKFAEALGSTTFNSMNVANATGGSAFSPLSRARRIREAVLALVAVAGIAGTAYFARRPTPEPLLGRFTFALPDSLHFPRGLIGKLGLLAVSRDSRAIVVVATTGSLGDKGHALYVRRLGDPALQRIRGTDSAISPSFSPDGAYLLFQVGPTLRKVPVGGGTPERVADGLTALTTVTWGDGGQIVYTSKLGQLWTVAANGGAPRRLTAVGDAVEYAFPEVLPGGRDVLVTGLRLSPTTTPNDSAFLAVVSLTDGRVTNLGVHGFAPHFVSSGHLVYSRGASSAYAVSFSLNKLAITGTPTLLLDGVSRARTGGTFDLPALAVGQTGGTLVGLLDGADFGSRALFAVSREGAERQLFAATDAYREPRVSPDGRHVVVRIGGVGPTEGDLWVYELATGARIRLTNDSASRRPEWSADGKQIAYFKSVSLTKASIMSRPWDLSAGETLLAAAAPGSADMLQEITLGPPHTWAAIRVGNRSGIQGAEIWIAPRDSVAAMRPLLKTSAIQLAPRIAPDGRTLAFASNESGRQEVYITPLPGPGAHVAVSVGGGEEPMWSRDGRALFYRSGNRLMVAIIAPGAEPRVTSRDSLFVDRYDRYSGFPNYDVLPDGRLLLIRQAGRATAASAGVTVIMNWPQLLRNAKAP